MVHPRRRLPCLGRRLKLAGPVAIGLILSACSLVDIENAPLDSLEPKGPFARQIDDLFWLVFWIAAGIFVIVQAAILVSVFLFRDREGRKEARQIHGSPKLEVAWTLIPALILAAVAVPTVRTLFDLTECSKDAIPIEVIGHQWWFEYRYPDAGVETANVLVIPVGREVCLNMTSADVIHSFWVPQLNGKRDLVPGQTTFLRLQADEPGLYWGQCAEFCGLSHALMRARVRAVPPAEFDAWLAAQQRPATPPEEGTQAFDGLQIYRTKGCTQCHTVDYGPDSEFTNIVPEEAFHGPNLTHFADREVFAGSAFPYEGLPYEEALRQWLADPPKAKPGSYMPNLGLTASEIEDLIAWLRTLE